MAIGDNIRSYRKDQKMTQAKLAELSGIHPVTIRKYETNKSVPQHAQVLKLAEALDLPYGFLYDSIDIVTTSKEDEIFNAILQLFKMKLLVITGERDKENCSLNRDTVSINASSIATELFGLKVEGESEIEQNKISLYLKEEGYFNQLLKWDTLNYIEEQQKLFQTKTPEELKKTWTNLSDEIIEILQNCSVETFGKLFFPKAFVTEE